MSLILKDWVNEIYKELTDTLSDSSHKISSGITKKNFLTGDLILHDDISTLISSIKGLSSNHYIGTYADCFANDKTLNTPAVNSQIDDLTQSQIETYVNDILRICGNQVLTPGSASGNTNYTRATGNTNFTGTFGNTNFTGASGCTDFNRATGCTDFRRASGCTDFTRAFNGNNFRAASNGTTFRAASNGTTFRGASGCTDRAAFGTESNSGLRNGNNYRAAFNSTCGQFSKGQSRCTERCSRTANFSQTGCTFSYFGNNGNVGRNGNNFSGASGCTNVTRASGCTNVTPASGCTDRHSASGNTNFTRASGNTNFTRAFGNTNFTGASGCTDFHRATGCTDFHRATGCTDFTPCPTTKVDFGVIIGGSVVTYVNYTR